MTRDKTKTLIAAFALTFTVTVILYGPTFIRKGIDTAYYDHQLLVADNKRLKAEGNQFKTKADRVAELEQQIETLKGKAPKANTKESPNSLRRRTIKVVNDINLFWSRRPLPQQPVQNPSTDEERQRNTKWDQYWHEANAAYANAGFRERILGIVRQYKIKGVDTGFLEQAAEQPERMFGGFFSGGNDCSRYQSELCQLRELAYHVDDQDNAIILTADPRD